MRTAFWLLASPFVLAFLLLAMVCGPWMFKDAGERKMRDTERR